MTNFPTSLPTDALILVVDKLRGKEVAWNQVALAGWNLLGYALAQIPQDTVQPILDEPAPETREAAANYLEEHLKLEEGFIQTGLVTWIVVAKIVLRFILNVV